jgi:hypothetical protein
MLQVKHSLLGETVSWNGSRRPTSFQQVQSRHSALPADQLLTLLRQHARTTKIAATSGTGSILGQISNVAVQVGLDSRVTY